jgi:glycosyltransferase involved in cell wall biosynthesis
MTSSSRSPFLSAVVCTHDRAALLRRMLESLCHQRLALDEFEVVLVDDGSTDATDEVARSFSSRLPLRYVYQRNAGLAAARNLGLFVARGEILLFLDDDDLADPRLLEAHAGAHRRRPEPEVAVLGYTQLAPELASDPLMHFVTQVGCLMFTYPVIEPGKILDFTYFWGGRSSCKRSMLLDHGIFNPVFRFGCEDVELAYRLSRHGFAVVYEPAARSTMFRGMSFDEFRLRVERQGRSNFVFSRLHREEVVQRWTEVPGAGEAWRRLGPVYDLLCRSARELDRVARMRLEEGLGLDGRDAALLYRAYWAALQASRVKGIVEQAAESGADLLAGTAPENASRAVPQ